MTGIGGRIAFAIQHGHSTKPLSNFALFSIALKTFIVQASVVSFVSDVVLGMLLSDDRLLVTLEAIEVRCRRRSVVILI